jgi:hypothetical protein
LGVHQQITQRSGDPLGIGENHQLNFFSLCQIDRVQQTKLPFAINSSDDL